MAVETVFVVGDSLLGTWSSVQCGWVRFVIVKDGAPTRIFPLAFPCVDILLHEAWWS